jgi:hypothetical protein
MNYPEYFRTRKTAVVITIIILVLGSIIYFSTEIAERNNEMMYKDIYGENATLNIVDNAYVDADDTASSTKNTRTILV